MRVRYEPAGSVGPRPRLGRHRRSLSRREHHAGSSPGASTSHSKGPGQGLVEVAQIERQVPLRRRPQTEVEDVRISAHLHHESGVRSRPRGLLARSMPLVVRSGLAGACRRDASVATVRRQTICPGRPLCWKKCRISPTEFSDSKPSARSRPRLRRRAHPGARRGRRARCGSSTSLAIDSPDTAPARTWQDAKLGLHHHGKWQRAAIVTDADWIRHIAGLFGWMVPGKFEVFPLAERDAAISWVAAD